MQWLSKLLYNFILKVAEMIGLLNILPPSEQNKAEWNLILGFHCITKNASFTKKKRQQLVFPETTSLSPQIIRFE